MQGLLSRLFLEALSSHVLWIRWLLCDPRSRMDLKKKKKCESSDCLAVAFGVERMEMTIIPLWRWFPITGRHLTVKTCSGKSQKSTWKSTILRMKFKFVPLKWEPPCRLQRPLYDCIPQGFTGESLRGQCLHFSQPAELHWSRMSTALPWWWLVSVHCRSTQQGGTAIVEPTFIVCLCGWAMEVGRQVTVCRVIVSLVHREKTTESKK